MGGYDALAEFMSSRRDMNIFRRFSHLNTESLLHMQAELLGLELTLEEIRKDPDRNGFNTSWLGVPDSNANSVIVGVFARVRELLDQYHKTLLQTARMNELDNVPDDSFDLLTRWHDSDEEKGGQAFLTGIGAAVFRDPRFRDDLLSINPRAGKDDHIAVFIADRVLPIYDRFVGYRFHSQSVTAVANAREYHMKALMMVANVICLTLSAAMPALSILVLFNVKSTLSRLVAVVLLSLAFSIVMTIVAQRKADIFMATTAFAAVLVVFVGSADGM